MSLGIAAALKANDEFICLTDVLEFLSKFDSCSLQEAAQWLDGEMHHAVESPDWVTHEGYKRLMRCNRDRPQALLMYVVANSSYEADPVRKDAPHADYKKFGFSTAEFFDFIRIKGGCNLHQSHNNESVATTANDLANATKDELIAEVEKLKQQLAVSESDVAKGKNKSTMLQVIAGLYLVCYRPLNTHRLENLSEVLGDLIGVGVDVSAETVRKYIMGGLQRIESESVKPK